MGITEDGIIPDIRIDACGIVGRLNSGQCIEQELNWVADLVKQQIKEKKSLDKQLKLLLKFIKMVNLDEFYQLEKYLENKSNEEKEKLIDDIINDRIYITQSPVYSITGDELMELYNEFEPKKVYMQYKDENGKTYKSMRKMIIADEYFLRLKQEPISKLSVRSKGMVNPRNSLPIKSTKASRHKSLFADQC